MAWQIDWDGTSWSLASHEAPDQPVETRPVIGGAGIRRTYVGAVREQARWEKLTILLGWTAVDATLYGTLDALGSYRGSVTISTDDLTIGTQTGYIDPSSVRQKSHGYASYDKSFTIECS